MRRDLEVEVSFIVAHSTRSLSRVEVSITAALHSLLCTVGDMYVTTFTDKYTENSAHTQSPCCYSTPVQIPL